MAEDTTEKLELPPLEDMDELDRCKLDYEKLRRMNPEPEDYCDRAESNEMEPHLKQTFRHISDAVACYYVASARRIICKNKDDIDGMRAWGEVLTSLKSLGVSDIMMRWKTM
mmetsp:Transcript_12076/g.17358  ORF Transcript_12076/g.17358 Transcript_12076/m.17358 type:complete len:112 (-) Transcript_12076:408-743(-)